MNSAAKGPMAVVTRLDLAPPLLKLSESRAAERRYPGRCIARAFMETYAVVSTQEIEEKVISIVCEQMGASKEKVSLNTSFIQDLGADSLDTVELVMEFEDHFNISIPDEEAEKIQTVGDAVSFISNNTSGS